MKRAGRPTIAKCNEEQLIEAGLDFSFYLIFCTVYHA